MFSQGRRGNYLLQALTIDIFPLGKFAQRSNMAKVELIKDPQVYFDYLSSDEINVLDVRFVSDEMVELRYEYNENFVEPNPKTNVVIAAFTTA